MQYNAKPSRNWPRRLKGMAFGWPWFDPVGSWALRRLFVPASLLWAAAETADTSVEKFFASARIRRENGDARRLAAVLPKIASVRARAEALEAEWQRTFFGGGTHSGDARRELEYARYGASHDYNMTRRHFGFMLRRDPPKILHEMQSPEQVAAIYGANYEKMFEHAGLPDHVVVEESARLERPVGTDYWLRFPSPSALLRDTVYARVLEPQGVTNPPTVIFGHGIGIEFDHWRGIIDEAKTLRALGFRVIRPVAPWHGRRRPRGSFGGEWMMHRMPGGLFDTFAGAAQEWAVLARWARKTSGGPLAYGGTSLGALIAQFAADRNGAQDPALRADGMFLITHSGRMTDATFGGQMASILGIDVKAATNGWTRESIEHCLGLLDPAPAPSVRPDRIVTVLGMRDRVTPYESGLSLVNSWGVPHENRFVWDRGHFSMPLTMIRNPAPVARFREVMARA